MTSEQRSDTNCPIREHAGDGAYVGRCEFAVKQGECPRHGRLADYPNRDDREVAYEDRRWPNGTTHPQRRSGRVPAGDALVRVRRFLLSLLDSSRS